MLQAHDDPLRFVELCTGYARGNAEDRRLTSTCLGCHNTQSDAKTVVRSSEALCHVSGGAILIRRADKVDGRPTEPSRAASLNGLSLQIVGSIPPQERPQC